MIVWSYGTRRLNCVATRFIALEIKAIFEARVMFLEVRIGLHTESALVAAERGGHIRTEADVPASVLINDSDRVVVPAGMQSAADFNTFACFRQREAICLRIVA